MSSERVRDSEKKIDGNTKLLVPVGVEALLKLMY
jgi:hypothetical protein